jgi:SAM-dependent methyltransferase
MPSLLQRIAGSCRSKQPDSARVGLADMHANGWFQRESGELAPGFHIDATDTCLDVGCGDGGMSLFAAAMGAAVIASDIDPARIATVRAALDRSRARDVTTIVSDSSPLPLADSTATRIICTEVLEHVEDPAAVLAELVRVGKPGAVYLLTVPDETAELVQKQLAPPAYWRSPNHLRVFSRQAFGDLVSASGLHVQHRCYTGFFWAVWWLLFWAADQEFGEPEVPLLASWSRTWHHLMKARDGQRVRRVLDECLPKSQVILASKSI